MRWCVCSTPACCCSSHFCCARCACLVVVPAVPACGDCCCSVFRVFSAPSFVPFAPVVAFVRPACTPAPPCIALPRLPLPSALPGSLSLLLHPLLPQRPPRELPGLHRCLLPLRCFHASWPHCTPCLPTRLHAKHLLPLCGTPQIERERLEAEGTSMDID